MTSPSEESEKAFEEWFESVYGKGRNYTSAFQDRRVAFLAGLAHGSRWIPVDTELPDKYKVVAVIQMNETERAAYFCEDKVWRDATTGDEVDVLFWLPLPAPPQEERKEK